MPKRPRSPHAHGPSEVWEKPHLRKAIRTTLRQVGGRLRALRARRDMTQEQVAEAAGLHWKHVQRIEAGTANATVGSLVALAHALHVEFGALLATRTPANPRSRP